MAFPGRLLEIGSSVGLFLDEAQRRGWDATGIEPSRWAAEKARGLGVRVFNGALDEFVPNDGPFDVVASWDVWEHLDDPMKALDRTFELLRPGGILVFTTLNMGGFGAKLFRGRWPWFMRMHLHYFTRGASAIKCCYAAAGSGSGAEETGLRAPVSRKTSIRDHKGIVVAKKMSRKVSRRVVRPACMAGVRISRPNFRAPCGRTKL